MCKGVSIKKITDSIPNEDSYRLGSNFISLSDGAGGCGVFASDWSRYLVNNISDKKPITSYEELDKWIDEIWEAFYQEHEKIALHYDGIFQSKFYSEGSCATIVAAWIVDEHHCKWISYGDSVVFHYNYRTKIFEHSFTKLSDFSNPPYLISCKDPLQKEGFNCGEFNIDDDSIIFACSDALSHYVLMMYMVSNAEKYNQEIDDISKSRSSEASMMCMAKSVNNFDFYNDIIFKLQDASSSEEDFSSYMRELYKRGLIDVDDYTIVFLKYGNETCNTL